MGNPETSSTTETTQVTQTRRRGNAVEPTEKTISFTNNSDSICYVVPNSSLGTTLENTTNSTSVNVGETKDVTVELNIQYSIVWFNNEHSLCCACGVSFNQYMQSINITGSNEYYHYRPNY